MLYRKFQRLKDNFVMFLFS